MEHEKVFQVPREPGDFYELFWVPSKLIVLKASSIFGCDNGFPKVMG